MQGFYFNLSFAYYNVEFLLTTGKAKSKIKKNKTPPNANEPSGKINSKTSLTAKNNDKDKSNSLPTRVSTISERQINKIKLIDNK